jgi:hypothetical protein
MIIKTVCDTIRDTVTVHDSIWVHDVGHSPIPWDRWAAAFVGLIAVSNKDFESLEKHLK